MTPMPWKLKATPKMAGLQQGGELLVSFTFGLTKGVASYRESKVTLVPLRQLSANHIKTIGKTMLSKYPN